jgi:high affinity sulfate transporter 1
LTSERRGARRPHILGGILPVAKGSLAVEALAGVTLAALAIPEVMGYSQIAGMPVVTGLYTLLLPVFAFAVLGSSRHLVVGADSATAAVMASGLAALAVTGSDQYVALAGAVALIAAALLLVARLARLGFIADFLSRTVLIGFLTGVGVQVAAGQVAGMLGVEAGSGGTLRKLAGTLANIGDTSLTTLAVSAAVIVVMLGCRHVAPKVPGALLAVIGAIAVSWAADLEAHGVATLGHLPGGLPKLGLPDVAWSDMGTLVVISTSIFVLILAQSAATSRAYAARYNEDFDENVDLVGLAGANLAAGVSGTFVVNGSPTKTQMVDGAGGRSQLAQVTTGVIVLIVLLFLTAPIQYLPEAVLASVVFLIGIELVDYRGMARIRRVRLDEFVVAALTAATVIVVGVEQGIILAIVASIVIHLRHSYQPNNSVLVLASVGRRPRAQRVTYDARTVPGLVVYRFAASLYFANANHLLNDVNGFIADSDGDGDDLAWLCIDAAAMADCDYTGAEVLKQAHASLTERGMRLVFTEMLHEVEVEFDTFGLTAEFGPDAFFPAVVDVITAFERRDAAGSPD